MDNPAAQIKHEANGCGGEARPRRSSSLKKVLGYLFALGCLVWVFHDVHPRRLLATMTIGNWWFVAASVFFDVLTYVVQGGRWTLLLKPVGHLRTAKATQAIYVGLFTNEVVPLRFGEIVRAFLASRWLSSGLSAIVPSMVVERFLDAVWLAVGIGIAAIYVPLPKNLLEAGDVLGLLVLVASIVFLWIVLRREREMEQQDLSRGNGPREAVAKSMGERMSRMITNLAAGLRQIGISRNLYIAAGLSGAMLVCQTLAVWFIMLACGIRLPIGAAAVVFLVVRLGTAIPNAPANVGSFQFFTVVALGLFGVDKTVAAGFSIIDFAALTAPLWIIGLFALMRTGMSLRDIRVEIAGLRSRVRPA